MAFDYQNPSYLSARSEAMGRSGGICQFCGTRPASETHHWRFGRYLAEEETTADELTALCRVCHQIATALRRHTRYGGSIWDFHEFFEEVLSRCDIESP